MKQDSLSSAKSLEISPRDAVDAVLGIESKLDQLSVRLTRMANRDQNTGASGDGERSPPSAGAQSFADILAGAQTSERRPTMNFTQVDERLDVLCEKFALGFEGFLIPEEGHRRCLHDDVAQDDAGRLVAGAGKSDETPEAAQEDPIGPALWSTASIAGDRPVAPVITHLENRIADLADQMIGHEAAQEDLRKLVQNGLDGLAQRIDATRRTSEAAVQRAHSQAVRLAQEELRKLAQSEFGRFGQRMDVLKQALEAAAHRAQTQAVRLAQEELRKLVLGEFGRLGERMEVLKRTSEAAAQRAQDQAVRLGHEELRKFVKGEIGTLAQRVDAMKQASEAAAQRAQTQAVQQAQTELRDLEGRMQALMKKTLAGAPEAGEIGRLRHEVESLGQRVDDLTVNAASEHELGSLRVAIEQVAARVAQGPDLKPLANFDRRLTEMATKLEQRLANHVGGQIGPADLDKRIAAVMRQNQLSPPWSIIERKLSGISDRLANTEMELQYVATHEKWILQLYRNLEETLDWTRDVAEDAANRMADRLTQEWSSETDPATTSAGIKPLEDALAAVRADYGNADQRDQETHGVVNEALDQINSKVAELEQLRDRLQLAACGIELASPKSFVPEIRDKDNFIAAVEANEVLLHSLTDYTYLRRPSSVLSGTGAAARGPTVG